MCRVCVCGGIGEPSSPEGGSLCLRNRFDRVKNVHLAQLLSSFLALTMKFGPEMKNVKAQMSFAGCRGGVWFEN